MPLAAGSAPARAARAHGVAPPTAWPPPIDNDSSSSDDDDDESENDAGGKKEGSELDCNSDDASSELMDVDSSELLGSMLVVARARLGLEAGLGMAEVRTK